MPDRHIDFEIAELIGKYLRNDIRQEEMDILEKWKEERDINAQLWDRLTHKGYASHRLKRWPDSERSDALWARLQTDIHGRYQVRARKRFPWWAAAAIIVMASAALVVYRSVFRAPPPPIAIAPSEVVVPVDVAVQEKPPTIADVTLIRSSGEAVSLGDGPASFREVDGTQIDRRQSELSYSAALRSPGLATVTNTVMTPVARTFKLILADGTRVWLNAASSIRYPTAFNGHERVVTLQGEAYFEVAPDKDKPFIVNAGKSRIQVLGTRFNVKSYPAERVDRTALLGGSLKVVDVERNQAALLQPGYEAVIRDGQRMAVGEAKESKVLAWKNGWFVFEDETLESLLKEVSTWYGIDVRFADEHVKNHHFTGRLQRYGNVRSLLDIIAETAKVTFTLRGNQLSVSGPTQTGLSPQ